MIIMKQIIFLNFIIFCNTAFSQIPQGTVRTVPGYGRTESYFGERGEFLGRSTPNNQGGRTYQNQYQYSARSVQTYSGGQRFTNTTPPTNSHGVYISSGGYGAFNQRSSKGK